MNRFFLISFIALILLASAIPVKAQGKIGSALKIDSISSIRDSAGLQIRDSLLRQDSLLLEKQAAKKSHFQLGLSYISNDVNLGRQDSSTINYYTPSLGYYHNSGLFALASMGYLLNSVESRIDEFTLQAGYDFTAGGYEGEFTASKYFFSSLSTNINSEVKYSLQYSNGYDFGFITPSLEGTLNFSSKTDILLGFALDHAFSVFDDALEIDPKLMGNAGTQNFYNDYYRKRRYTITRKGKAPLKGIAKITGTVENPGQFKMLDYEASAEFTYTAGKFTFSFLPTYAIPLNPSVIDITKVLQTGAVTTKSQTELLSNTFYWTLGVQFNF